MLRSQAARAQSVGSACTKAASWRSTCARAAVSAAATGVEAQVQVGAVVVPPLLLGRAVRDQLAAPAAQVLKVLDRGAGLGAQRGTDLRREPRQHAGIDAVGLGQDAVGAGEVAGLAGIDADDRQTGRAQGDDHGALVAAAGFQHDAAGPQRLELPLQPPQAAARARHRPGRARGLDGDVQPGLRHIDPYRYVRVGRHWVPSGNAGHTPCLADAGSC